MSLGLERCTEEGVAGVVWHLHVTAATGQAFDSVSDSFALSFISVLAVGFVVFSLLPLAVLPAGGWVPVQSRKLLS